MIENQYKVGTTRSYSTSEHARASHVAQASRAAFGNSWVVASWVMGPLKIKEG